MRGFLFAETIKAAWSRLYHRYTFWKIEAFSFYFNGFSPRTTLMSTAMIANTRRIWINPPNMKEVVTARSQSTASIAAIAISIGLRY